jgi:hypothetical protein
VVPATRAIPAVIGPPIGLRPYRLGLTTRSMRDSADCEHTKAVTAKTVQTVRVVCQGESANIASAVDTKKQTIATPVIMVRARSNSVRIAIVRSGVVCDSCIIKPSSSPLAPVCPANGRGRWTFQSGGASGRFATLRRRPFADPLLRGGLLHGRTTWLETASYGLSDGSRWGGVGALPEHPDLADAVVDLHGAVGDESVLAVERLCPWVRFVDP